MYPRERFRRQLLDPESLFIFSFGPPPSSSIWYGAVQVVIPSHDADGQARDATRAGVERIRTSAPQAARAGDVPALCVQSRIMYHPEPHAARPGHRGSRIAQVRQPTGSAAQSRNRLRFEASRLHHREVVQYRNRGDRAAGGSGAA